VEASCPIAILVPSPGSSASARIVESSDTLLRERLLTLADLPAGWTWGTGAGVQRFVVGAALAGAGVT
jgi:hypothetical protein